MGKGKNDDENKKNLRYLQNSRILGAIKDEEGGFYNVPEGTATNIVMEVLGSGGDVHELPERKKKVSHSAKITVLENGNKRQVVYQNKNEQVSLEVIDIDKITKSNKTAKKMFVLSLIKANEQALHNGELSNTVVSFPLQELIDIGFYSTKQSARKGFKDGMEALAGMMLKGKHQKNKKKEITVESMRVLFTGYDITNGQCTIYLNEHMDWGFIAQYFTILPKYYFRLPNRSSDLLFYISCLARQRSREIAEKGYFNISFRAIQSRLHLPSEVGCNNPGRHIKEEIEKAIEDIENENAKVYDGLQFTLTPIYNENATIAEFLNNGYLRVGMTEEFAETFVNLNKSKVKGIESAKKRDEAIVDKAKAMKMAKSMEEKETDT